MSSPFTYCLNTSTIMYQPAVMEQIRLAAKHGFGAIELWLRDVQRYVAGGGQVADVAKSVKDHGLFVPNVIAMHGWGNAPESAYPPRSTTVGGVWSWPCSWARSTSSPRRRSWRVIWMS